MALDFSYLDTMLDEEFEEVVEETADGYRHVWVVTEGAGGTPMSATLELLGQGRDIADQFGVYLYGILLGSNLDDTMAQELVRYGADKVLVVDDPALVPYQVETYTKALAALVDEWRPEILLMTASPLGDDLAPRLAQRLNTGLVSHCVQLSLDMAERQLLGTFGQMDGEVFHTLACPEARPQMATLEPGAFRPAYEDPYRSGEIERVVVELDGVEGRINWVEFEVDVKKRPVPLTESRVIISAGRGLKDREGFALVQQLADALGGQVAGSRGALDEGWIDEEQQVGMTGKTVSPDLYVACGISGAIQHAVGMQEAGFVIAINRDEQAPIMEGAHVGVVGDATELLKALIRELTGQTPSNNTE